MKESKLLFSHSVALTLADVWVAAVSRFMDEDDESDALPCSGVTGRGREVPDKLLLDSVSSQRRRVWKRVGWSVEKFTFINAQTMWPLN